MLHVSLAKRALDMMMSIGCPASNRQHSLVPRQWALPRPERERGEVGHAKRTWCRNNVRVECPKTWLSDTYHLCCCFYPKHHEILYVEKNTQECLSTKNIRIFCIFMGHFSEFAVHVVRRMTLSTALCVYSRLSLRRNSSELLELYRCVVC